MTTCTLYDHAANCWHSFNPSGFWVARPDSGDPPMTDLWVLTDAGEEWEIERPATNADILSAALNLEGVETVDSVGVTFEDMPDGYDGLILAVPSRGWNGPGRYAIIPLPPEADE